MSHDVFCCVCVCVCVCACVCVCVCVGVTEYIETGSGSDDALSGMETDKLTEEALRTVFAGVHTVLTSALRLPRLKSEASCTVRMRARTHTHTQYW